ncbi:hypothetical protein QF018_005599, partial [Pseudomonas laurylsulfatiphila]
GRSISPLNLPASSPASRLLQLPVGVHESQAHQKSTVGAGLPAMAVGRSISPLNLPASSPASRLLQLLVGVHESQAHKKSTVGAGLPAMAVGRSISLLNLPASSPASRLPQGLLPTAEFAFNEDQNCGSELARDSGLSANISVGYAGPFAGKPTQYVCGIQNSSLKGMNRAVSPTSRVQPSSTSTSPSAQDAPSNTPELWFG